MRPARTILAVLLGYLCLLAIELLGAFLFRGTIGGEFVAFVSGVIAGAVTARVAASRPLLHAIVLGVVVVSITCMGAAFAKRPVLQGIPVWYPYAIALLAGAGIFIGGALAARPNAKA